MPIAKEARKVARYNHLQTEAILFIIIHTHTHTHTCNAGWAEVLFSYSPGF